MEARIMRDALGWIMRVEESRAAYRINRDNGWLCVRDGDDALLLRVKMDARTADIEEGDRRYRAEVELEPYACAALPEHVSRVSVEDGLTMRREAGGWRILVNGHDCGQVKFGLLAHQVALQGQAEPWAVRAFALMIAAEECEGAV